MKRYKWSAIFLAGLVAGTTGILQADDQDPTQVFKSLDRNSDGKLQEDEIPEAQRRFFDRLLRVGDKDADGVLSQDEYTKGLAEPPREGFPGAPGGPEGGRRPFPGGGGDRPDPGQMFDRMDANKDGKLTRDELPEFLQDRMGRVFDALGKDSLSKEELGRAMAQYGGRGGPDGRPGEPSDPPPGGPPEGRGFPGAPGGPGVGRGPAFLRALDANGDMQLSGEEIEGATAKLKTLDHNSDGVLDMMELIGAPGPGFPGGPPLAMGRDGERPPGGPRDGERPPGGPRDGERPPGGGFGGPPAIFHELDADQNGRLSQEELSKAVSKLDRNGDGELDMGEVLGGGPMGGREGGPLGGPFGGPPGGFGQGFNPEEMMKRMDRNADGKVTKDELPERIRERFDELDKNKDGSLAGDEVRDAIRGMIGGGRGFPGRPGEGRPEGDRPRRPQPEGAETPKA